MELRQRRKLVQGIRSGSESITCHGKPQALRSAQLASTFPLRRSYSADGGRTWSPPDLLPAVSVEPSLKRLQNGVLALSTGRPGISLWLSTDERGAHWQSIDILAHHNQWAPDAGYTITPAQTTAYTEIIEVAPNRLLLAYDRTPFGWQPTPADSGERNRIFLLPIEVIV